jgi:hypothetical protein
MVTNKKTGMVLGYFVSAGDFEEYPPCDGDRRSCDLGGKCRTISPRTSTSRLRDSDRNSTR